MPLGTTGNLAESGVFCFGWQERRAVLLSLLGFGALESVRVWGAGSLCPSPAPPDAIHLSTGTLEPSCICLAASQRDR